MNKTSNLYLFIFMIRIYVAIIFFYSPFIFILHDVSHVSSMSQLDKTSLTFITENHNHKNHYNNNSYDNEGHDL